LRIISKNAGISGKSNEDVLLNIQPTLCNGALFFPIGCLTSTASINQWITQS